MLVYNYQWKKILFIFDIVVNVISYRHCISCKTTLNTPIVITHPYWFLLCQFDPSYSHLERGKEARLKQREPQDWFVDKPVKHDLGWCHIWESPAHCGKCHPWTLILGVIRDSLGNTSEHSSNSTSPWILFLAPRDLLWSPALASLHDGLISCKLR